MVYINERWKNGFETKRESIRSPLGDDTRIKEEMLGCKLSMNGAFFDRRIEMRPVPRDYANFMINNQCSEEGHIAPITRTGMHYHNLKRWLSITPLIANNRVNCCLSSLSLSRTHTHILLSLHDILQLCTMLPLIIRSTNNSWWISFLLPTSRKKMQFSSIITSEFRLRNFDRACVSQDLIGSIWKNCFRGNDKFKHGLKSGI